MRHGLMIAVCAVLAGCQPKAVEDAAMFDVATPLEEVMEHVIDPSAKAFWAASGTIIDADGEHSLVPTTDEGWQAAENGIMTVVEASNLLLLPARRRDDAEWIDYTKSMNDVARSAFKATLARDGDQMFVTGAALYQTCLTCHEKYVNPYLDSEGYPSKLGPDGRPNPLLKDNPPAK